MTREEWIDELTKIYVQSVQAQRSNNAFADRIQDSPGGNKIAKKIARESVQYDKLIAQISKQLRNAGIDPQTIAVPQEE